MGRGPPCWPKGSYFGTILIYQFLVTDPKNVLQLLPACSSIFNMFFQHFACGAENLGKTCSF